MSFTIKYLMKIDRIHVYYRAMKSLKHGFATNAHRKFNPRPINSPGHRAFIDLGLNSRVRSSESHVVTSKYSIYNQYTYEGYIYIYDVCIYCTDRVNRTLSDINAK